MKLLNALFLIAVLSLASQSQIPVETLVRILKAEDARRYDQTLEVLTRDKAEAIQLRAILAVGRIGDVRAVSPLTSLLTNGTPKVREMAAFALGEIESSQADDALLQALKNEKQPAVIARLVEAAGKIAAADPKGSQTASLRTAIMNVLEAESILGNKQHPEVIRLGLTAALRTRPAGAGLIVAKFLTNASPQIRSDAANTMSRLKATNANAILRKLLTEDTDAVARANAARALGTSGDSEAFDLLLDAATKDNDLRVRVSAIRSLGDLKNPKAAGPLIDRGETLLTAYLKAIRPNFNPNVTNELLEIVSALGRLLKGSNDPNAAAFLTKFGTADMYRSEETEAAFAKISPVKYVDYAAAKNPKFKSGLRATNAALAGFREFAALDDSPANKEIKAEVVKQLRRGLSRFASKEKTPTAESIPELLTTLSAFKPEGLDAELRLYLTASDVFIRATAAGLLADLPSSKENLAALNTAFGASLVSDKEYDDAQLAILDAMYKLDKAGEHAALKFAIDAPDYLVRKKALELLSRSDNSQSLKMIEDARSHKKDQVLPYDSSSGTKLGQLLNTDADYRRAALRKNGTVKAVLTTEKGIFTINLLAENAPLTVDNFIKLARAKYFNGLAVHRVVPNFVMQDGDPRGDGNGGPGWSIRCEINMIPYGRGAVGMALSGKDTGGSQWFVTHAPQPHLDGGYTVFGTVSETEMKVVDNIVRGDKIVSVKILETAARSRK